MNDLSKIVDNIYSDTASKVTGSVDDNPDDAADSVRMEGSTGVPATVISGDLDNFRGQYRRALSTDLVMNNPALRDYVNSHPMAAAVSNDDWGNLDQFSRGAGQTSAVIRLLNKDPLHRVLDPPLTGALIGAKEGFMASPQEAEPFIQQHEQQLGIWGTLGARLLFGGGEMAQRLMGGIAGAASGAARGAGTEIGGEGLGRELAAMTEYEMMKGEAAHAWAASGKEIPTGVHSSVDQVKAQINANVLSMIDRDVANAQASATKARSPEMFQRLVNYGDATIGIHGDAVAGLYGDNLPTPNDGLLGWVPGIGDQLALAKATGADVHVPIKDWVSNVDPQIAQRLHDDIRVWPGGITAREVQTPIQPKEVIDAPLAQVRAQGLEPMFMMGDRKLTLANRKDETINLGAGVPPGQANVFEMLDENGRKVGELEIIPGQNKQLFINMINGTAGMWANSFGPALIRDLLRQLKREYPDYVGSDGKISITGYRVSGARENIEDFGPMPRPVIRLDTDGWNEDSVEQIGAFRQLLDEHWHEISPDLYANIQPTSMYLAHEREMAQVVHDEIRRLVGEGPTVSPVAGLVHEEFGRINAAYVPFEDRAPAILYDMLGDDPLGAGRHEAIHYLRRYGVLSPEEWDTLAQAARDEGWGQRYGIDDRYSGLDDDSKVEEAVAEAFREWAGSDRAARSNTAGIFQKLWDFLSRIKDRFKELFGHVPTADELFQRIQSGQVGRRGPEGAFDLRPRFSADDMDNLRANSLGLDAKSFKRIQELVQDRYRQDVEASVSHAQKEQARRQTKEWKENEASIRQEVEATIRQRPDVAADLFLGSGELFGEKLRQRYTLRADDLTPEQKAALPKHYVSNNGFPVDEVAKLFGYGSGDAMIERLVGYNTFKGDLSPQEMVRKIVDEETNRQMEAKYGQLDQNIMNDAIDQALSENNLNILAEEMMAAGLKAGVKTIGKEEAKAWVQEQFGKLSIGSVSSDKFLSDLARHGRDAERALIAKDPASAVVSLQKKLLFGLLAMEARKLEKEQMAFDRQAKQLSARVIPSMDPEYTNYIHQILIAVGKPVRRSIQDLREQVEASVSKGLEQFVKDKSEALRELPIWDQLYDQNWRKELPQLTVEEFRAVRDSVKALAHNGRDELKIVKAGEAADLAIIKTIMIDQLSRFGRLHYDAKGGRWMGPLSPRVAHALRSYGAVHIQIETLLNRWDQFDPHGVWNQYVMRDLIDGANQEDAWKKEYAKVILDADDGIDLKKSVNNTIFRDPSGGHLFQFNRGNLRAVLLNVGNRSNLVKMAHGYGLKSDQVMEWLHAHATKEDWDWAQKIWDMFATIKDKSDTMYRSLTGGVAAESIQIDPISTSHGIYRGGYYPIIFHPEFEGKSKASLGRDALEQENYVRAPTPAGYTKSRTGYVAPLALDIDPLPGRMTQMLHDIAMRPAVLNASKIFYDHDVRATIRTHYGSEYRDLLVPYLRDVANSANYMSKAQSDFKRWSEFMRQNMVMTLVGVNPGTILKHGPTALVQSMQEVGPINFLKAMKSLFSINEATGESNWQFAMQNSQELQRRHRNYRETLTGVTEELLPKGPLDSLRQTVLKYSSMPVAMSDLVSAVPTWLAKYVDAIKDGATHGDAVYLADRSVRRAHGSTAITNRPAIMRDWSPWFTSVYSFFNHIMNRQAELLWKAGDVAKLVKEGQQGEAMKKVPELSAMLFAYVLAPALIEELVSPLTTSDNESWGKKAAKGLAFTLGASWVGVRDFASAILNGRDPSVGIYSTAEQTFSNFIRDFGKREPLSPVHVGRLIQDGSALAGLLTGLVPEQIGRTGRFVEGVQTGIEHPRGPWGWLVGARYGTLKGHSTTWQRYMEGRR